MFSNQLIQNFRQVRTPFYFYDTGLLHKTLFAIKEAAGLYNYKIHYAVKANANKKILNIISNYGIGADCVSGNEIKRALATGFSAHNIVFAGVGKTDEEIRYSIQKNIFCFNIESIQELDVINGIAKSLNKTVRVALRINPNIDPNTHQNITTGLSINKFGISLKDMNIIISNLNVYNHLIIDGLHFHIGSQITDFKAFHKLCEVVNGIQKYLLEKGIHIRHINLGGGFGINYQKPENQIPDFQAYLNIFNGHLEIQPWQTVHFEPGRSVIGQSGALISRVLYLKENANRKTIILDAGFTELLRPALYQSNHKIVNLTSNQKPESYDIAGPICETSDYFGKSVLLPKTKRGDLIAILSTGAYGEVMASQYNLRSPAAKYYSDELLPVQIDQFSC